MTQTSLRVFSGASGIAALREDWKQLCRRTGAESLMQSPEYYESYANILATDDSAVVAAAFYRDGQLIAVLPLAVAEIRKFGVSIGVITFPETPIPVRSFVTIDGVTIDGLVKKLRHDFRLAFGRSWDFMRLTGYISYAAEPGGQSDSADRNRKRIGKNNFLDLSNPDYFSEVLSANMRSNLTRRMKRLEKLGEWAFETIDQLPDLDNAFEEFIETEAAGWKSHRGGKRAIKLHEDQQLFYRDLLTRYADSGNCHIHLLRLDGRTIAADFVLVSGDTAYSLKHGYDETYSEVTPSNLLRKYTIDFYSESENIRTLDLVSGYEWQSRWKPESRPVFEIRYFNNTAKGMLLRIYDALTKVARADSE
jgi:CelD/BcsL family acetyltransferase involved in cellulose biosynthesis